MTIMQIIQSLIIIDSILPKIRRKIERNQQNENAYIFPTVVGTIGGSSN